MSLSIERAKFPGKKGRRECTATLIFEAVDRIVFFLVCYKCTRNSKGKKKRNDDDDDWQKTFIVQTKRRRG